MLTDEHVHQALGALDLLHGDVERLLEQLDPSRQSNATTRELVAFLDVKGARTRLFGLNGWNEGPDQYLHLYDRADLPADGEIPDGTVVLPIAAASAFSLDYGLRGRHFTNGLVIACSTTGATKTLGTASLWLDVQYD